MDLSPRARARCPRMQRSATPRSTCSLRTSPSIARIRIPGRVTQTEGPSRPFVPEWPSAASSTRPFVPEWPPAASVTRPFVPEWPLRLRLLGRYVRRREASVDQERRTIHVARFVAGEEQRRVRDLPRFAQAADRQVVPVPAARAPAVLK